MKQVIASAWALLLGMLLLQVGNGLQGTLMGVRGGIEGFSTFELSLVASAYFVGFLGGSRLAPEFIRRVGHVRVFAALGSMISAVLILFPVIADPWVWVGLRIIIGFSLSGVYVTAESWLNNAATNETRGQALSAYMVVQMVGLVAAQGILTLGDPAGYILFIIPSVLVSLSFAPILLSVTPTPVFDTARPMSLIQLYRKSPLGFVGMFLTGAVFAGQFGMSAVYATMAGLSVPQLSAFISSFFIGGIFLQFPIGWLSDRMDRRILICGASFIAGILALVGAFFGHVFLVLIVVTLLSGGLVQPLYPLLIAYTNDYLDTDEMAGASGSMIFVNGIGAIGGPPLMGWMMTGIGPKGFWIFLAGVLFSVAVYATWRMTRRASAYANEPDYDAVPYASMSPTSSPVAIVTAQELYVEAAEGQAEAALEEAEKPLTA